jgi:hypothetical protein
MLDLIQRYAEQTGAQLERIQPQLMKLRVAPGDARFFGGRFEHLLALSVTALQQHPEAELPVPGSAFWNGLLLAIRERGQRRIGGALPVTVSTSAAAPDFKTVGATVELVESGREQRRLMRLSTRLTLGAGTTVEEQLVQSDVIDLATGAELGDWIDALWSAPAIAAPDIATGSIRTPEQLIAGIIAGIEDRVTARLQELELESQRTLKEEIARIDRYYGTVLAELRAQSGPGTPGEVAILREHEKRRAEETRRHQVRVEVEPVQVEERTIVTERARWQLATPNGRTAELTAHRYLAGPALWEIRCPCCLTAPAAVTVCSSGHAAGIECTRNCTVCADAFCTEHGYPSCSIDGAPMCAEHGAVCFSCERDHCTAHQAICTETRHIACTTCVRACAVCTRMVCAKHGVQTDVGAPRGQRFVCGNCVTHCEGGTSEPVGIDEAALCATCGKHICERHQVVCVVDGKPHCSKHLRRADRSRRFICEMHQAACTREPGVVFASDEVQPCVQCSAVSCGKHGAPCHEDQAWHCVEHMATLTDIPNAFACKKHESVCHIDQRAFSLKGTDPCEICGQPTCRSHRRPCNWCGARVCLKDFAAASRCVTCAKLTPTADIPDEIVSAAARLVPRGGAKSWSLARDGGRYVVEINLGWTRRIVFSVLHGTAEPVHVRRHSIFGSTAVS